MSDGPTAEQAGGMGPGANVAEVPPSGPLCLTGRIQVEVDGEIVADTDDVALCRCGHSSNKPFCDGSHNKVGFDDPGVILGGRLVPGPEAADVGEARQRRPTPNPCASSARRTGRCWCGGRLRWWGRMAGCRRARKGLCAGAGCRQPSRSVMDRTVKRGLKRGRDPDVTLGLARAALCGSTH